MPRPTQPRRGLLFSNFSSSQEGWEVQACSKSSSIEQVYPVQALQDGREALQDGRDPHRERSPEERGLHDKDRFEGCVFRCPCPLSASEVPAIPMEGSNLRVFVSSIWSSPSSPGLYEGAEASGRLPTEHGGSLCNLHRRPLADAPEQTGPEGSHNIGVRPLEALGFLINYPKSQLEQSQIMDYLGFVIDSIKKELRLLKEKLDQIRLDARQMLKESMVSARELAQLIGCQQPFLPFIQPHYTTEAYKCSSTRH